MDMATLDIEKLAQAVEDDAGQPIEGLRESLAELKGGIVGRTTTPAQILLRQARQKSGLTQLAFAELIATPVATLRDWEQGRFVPPGGVLCLFRLMVKHPELSRELESA